MVTQLAIQIFLHDDDAESLLPHKWAFLTDGEKAPFLNRALVIMKAENDGLLQINKDVVMLTKI